MTNVFCYGIISATQIFNLRKSNVVKIGRNFSFGSGIAFKCARNLDILVSEMKEKTGLIQLDRVLSIVALNLSFELTQEKNKTLQIEDVLRTKIQQLDHSLGSVRVLKE